MEYIDQLKTFNFKKEPPRAVSLDLNEPVRKAVSLLEYQMRAKNIPLYINLCKEPLVVKGDFHLLSQALLHMLLGIIRSFESYEGEKHVEISTSRQGKKAVLRLKDSLVGHREESPDIFKSHDVPGKMRGLGTPLANRIIKIHGGDMAFRSLKRGRSFRIELPLVKTRAARAKKSLHILVVDDDAIVADVFKGYLDLLGHKTTVMFSPLEALELVARESFDLVLVDFRMPEMDGITFINKAQQFMDKNRLWLLTGDVLSFEVELLRKRGNVRILEKPVNMEKFKVLFDMGDER